MPSWLIMALFLVGCVLFTALLAAGGSGWRAGIEAFKGFGAWMGGLLLFGFLVWLLMPIPKP